MVKVKLQDGKILTIVEVSEGVQVSSEISKDNATKMIQQLKAALINSTEPAVLEE